MFPFTGEGYLFALQHWSNIRNADTCFRLQEKVVFLLYDTGQTRETKSGYSQQLSSSPSDSVKVCMYVCMYVCWYVYVNVCPMLNKTHIAIRTHDCCLMVIYLICATCMFSVFYM
jgi:hypothetical protein